MRRTLLGALLGAGLAAAVVVAFGSAEESFAQRSASPQPAYQGSELIVVPTPAGEKTQVLTVVDPRNQVMAVYHVDQTTGKIALRSVRSLRWDLMMMEFNGENPLPGEIRNMLESR